MHQLDRIEEALNKLLDDRKVVITVQQAASPAPMAAAPDLGLMDRSTVRCLVADMFKALRDDRKIEAVKAHRALTNYGIKESKDVIETVTDRFDKLRKLEAVEPESVSDLSGQED